MDDESPKSGDAPLVDAPRDSSVVGPLSEPLAGSDEPTASCPPPTGDGPIDWLPDHQKTVISKRPPVGSTPRSTGSPLEMGRTLEGQRLGHFQLEEFVGGGGMGAVFRATDTMLGRTVAVKVVARDHTDEETLRRFRNEAQSAARLNHENIARVYYVGEDRGWNYIVFEFIEGVNVRDLVDHKGPLPLEEAISYTLQVTEALRHAAERDVVHRDIKPSNVLVTPDGHVKLVDMGLARLHQVESSSADLTASGVTLGTFDYISPEQARDPRSADVRSDLYSLGCTLYFMLTGVPPFPEGTVLQKLLSHSSDPPPDVRLHRPELPDEVANLIRRLMAKTPAHRPQTPSELIAELLMLSKQLGLPLPGRLGTIWVTHAQSRYQWLERHLPWAVPLTALFAAVLTLHLLWSPSSSSDLPPVRLPELDTPPVTARATGFPVGSEDEPTERVGTPDQGSPAATSPVASSRTTDVANANSTSSTGGATNSSTRGSGASSGSALPPTIAAPLPTDARTELGPEMLEARLGLDQDLLTLAAVSSGTFASDGYRELPARSPTGKIEVRRVVLGPKPDQPLPDAAYVNGTLHDALLELDKYPTADTIEIHKPRLVETQLTLSITRPITITGGPDVTPIVLFQPDPTTYQRAALYVSGGRLQWRGVHLMLDLPSDDWAFFQLLEVEELKFRDCTLSMRNLATSSSSGATFFRIEHSMGVSMSEPEEPSSERSPKFELVNVVVRGPATLIRPREDDSYPFELSWENGLLATNQRLVEVQGAVTQLNSDLNQARIKLRNVTALAGKGLFQLTLKDYRVWDMGLKLETENCVYLTQPDAALFDVTNLNAMNQATTTSTKLDGARLFDVSGRNSYFEGPSILLRTNNQARVRLEDRPEWFQINPQLGISWRGTSVPPAKPLHEHAPEDYQIERLVGRMTSPSNLGFISDKLPQVPTWPEGRSSDASMLMPQAPIRSAEPPSPSGTSSK